MSRPNSSARDAAGRGQAWANPASLVVEASAGTGKTSLLIQRALWLLLDRDVKIERLVALTFAEKAAAEMADRLRAALRKIAAASAHQELPEAVRDLHPGLSLERAKRAAAAALAAFPRARISTIHSFAASLLRLFPVEAGVPPDFRIIESPEEEAGLAREWELFLADELKPGAERETEWRRVLGAVPVRDLREMARVLAGFRTDLKALQPNVPEAKLHPELAGWLERMDREATELEEGLGPRNKKPAQMLAALKGALKALRERGREEFWKQKEALSAAPEIGAGWPKAWEPELKARGRALDRDLRALKAAAGEPEVRGVLALLLPFAARARAGLLAQGLITYDGLLSRARDLLHERLEVREALKRRIDAILVDEMQDTDPIQLEILLYLAETPQGKARDWRKVKLAPGRLLLVGDPKQSIYAFRHADLKAYQTVMQMAGEQGAAEIKLSTSMRSAEPIIAAVNACGDALFAGGSPAYLPLEPNPERAAGSRARPVLLEVRPLKGERRLQESEARTVADYICGRLKRGKMFPRSFAILFPKKLHMPAYADALRVRGVPVTIEEERRFYLRTEIGDLVNALRLLADPADAIALAGFLRGPFGRLPDPELGPWFARLRADRAGPGWESYERVSRAAGTPPGLAGTFAALSELAVLRQFEPARIWLEGVWARLAVDALAEASGRPGARQAVESFKRLLGRLFEERGIRAGLEIVEDCRRAEARSEEPPVRPPALAALPDLDAVRLLTIHQAKGLEFPAVVVADLGSAHKQTRTGETVFRQDWSSGLAGISLPGRESGEALSTLEGAFLTTADILREQAQDRRVLYVGLTRARDELVIPFSPEHKTVAASLVAILEPALAVHRGLFEVLAPAAAEEAEVPAPRPAAEPVRRGTGRRDYETPAPHLTPSAGLDRFSPVQEPWLRGTSSAEAILGELCHRVLEKWDFMQDAGGLRERIDAAALDLGGAPQAMCREGFEILSRFLTSPAAERLRRAEILGREVPLVARMGDQAVSARADLLCRMDGGLVVADYKLGREPDLPGRAAEIYRQALKAALGEEARFAVVSLKAGTFNFL